MSLRDTLADLAGQVRRVATRGPDHRRRLATIDTRIVVSGTRGKSGTTRRLHDIFTDRGRDTVAKITGNRPHILHNGDRHEIERGPRVTMYENAREIRDHTPDGVLIVENQAITEYTNWVVNDFYVKPHVIVIPNIRQDHLDTLGGDRESIARSLVRSVPPGIHVVNAEQNPELQQYIDRELRPKGVTVTHVDVPDEHQHVLAAESIYALAEVARIAGTEPLCDDRIQRYLDEMRVSWTHLDGGRFSTTSLDWSTPASSNVSTSPAPSPMSSPTGPTFPSPGTMKEKRRPARSSTRCSPRDAPSTSSGTPSPTSCGTWRMPSTSGNALTPGLNDETRATTVQPHHQ